MAFETLLLVSGKVPTNDPVLRMLVDSLGFPADVAGTTRPRIGLRVDGRNATLAAQSASDADDFLDLVFGKRAAGVELSAFSLMPPRALEQLFSANAGLGTRRLSFTHGGRTITARYAAGGGGQPEPADTPYVRHLLRFQYQAAAAQGGGNVLTDGAVVDEELLLIDPRALVLADDVAAHLSRNALAGLCRSAHCMVLPPGLILESGPSDSYYSADRSWRRHSVRTQVAALAADPQEPAVVTLWRLADEPALRDALREGGVLRLAHEAEGPSKVVLALTSGSDDPVPAFRRRVLFDGPGPTPPAGAPWTEAVARCLREGITSVLAVELPGGESEALVAIATGPGVSMDWSVEPQWSSDPAEAPRMGAWNVLDVVFAKLGAGTLREALYRDVLEGASARDHYAPDHKFALSLFVASYWRCPWDRSAGPGPWRDAVWTVLEWIANGTAPPPEKRFGDQAWRGVQRDPVLGLVVAHHPANAARLLEYRLLLPVGATLLQCGSIRLDDPTTTLDQGYELV